MLPEIGNYALMLALALALVQGIVPLVGAQRADARWMAVARPATFAQVGFSTLAFACLASAFVQHDFSVLYVAQHSNSLLPWYYRVTATWGGHEGSLLLWTWMLGAWSAAVALFSRRLPGDVVARVLAVLGLVSTGFLLFMLLTSNPFARLIPAALDGQDLNPLLQDFGMIIHPPLLYMGYVGFSVAFAFAIAALLAGRLDAAWARWSRPWTLLAWSFLTLGIFMGSFWAYYELGWGGWWFWDAVENASFMPWLVGTALVHSLIVSEKRGSFRSWTVLLAILAFSLSLLGTFLVRSGVLTSVHAFATDPERGAFILVFLTLVIGLSLLLYAWRVGTIGGGGGRFTLFSRESLLLANNVVLLAATAAVLLGTLYPLFVDALELGKISVGPPYFETVFVPLMVPALLLVAVGPFVAWKSGSARSVARQLAAVAAASVVLAGAAAVAVGATPMVAVGLLAALWIVAGTAWQLVYRIRRAPPGMPFRTRLAREPASWWGMLVAHAGLGIFVAGVTVANGFDAARDASMRAGDTVTLGQYAFRLTALDKVAGPNYHAVRGTFAVTQNGKPVAVLTPEKRLYTVQNMPMTEAAIARGPLRDLYVSLGEETASGRWLVRVQHKPFMAWIWAGALLVAAGGLAAAADRRYRAAMAVRAAPAAIGEPVRKAARA
ncbi:heme lyase CcmF/NrfE family subunit [Pseudoduganella sp. SL102]|uniref:heme lyase CcmF/NrfE family subunit n=1 Tax=Pseudoduganella sp. SL102 TaxID=2995154 RepID=UPI00248ADE9D|nr:heme lyase CcmF/NrfE family subunit [Pseudoduganella sp. SL102]WBS00976.1 heme lyase CcmF/NrfE family subunit [Pseudoduganella sp. SL102]